MLDQATITKIQQWANGQDATDHDNKFFGASFTDKVRRDLRSMSIDRPDEANGRWRDGYEIVLADGSIIGVGTVIKHSKLFCIYFKTPTAYQPATVGQVASWRRS